MRQCGGRARQRKVERSRGKIKELRAACRKDKWPAAQSLVALLYRGEFETEAEEARVYTAALLLVDAMYGIDDLVKLVKGATGSK